MLKDIFDLGVESHFRWMVKNVYIYIYDYSSLIYTIYQCFVSETIKISVHYIGESICDILREGRLDVAQM